RPAPDHLAVGVVVEVVEADGLHAGGREKALGLVHVARCAHEPGIGHEERAPESQSARELSQAGEGGRTEHDARPRREVEGLHALFDSTSSMARGRAPGLCWPPAWGRPSSSWPAWAWPCPRLPTTSPSPTSTSRSAATAASRPTCAATSTRWPSGWTRAPTPRPWPRTSKASRRASATRWRRI